MKLISSFLISLVGTSILLTGATGCLDAERISTDINSPNGVFLGIAGLILSQAPAAPSSVIATGGDGTITLSWTNVSGAAAYNIYYSTSPGITTSTGTQIPDVSSPYIHTGLANGTDYYYTVTAVSGSGAESDIPEEVRVYPYLAPMKTGLTQCWDNSGTLMISCAGTGQDGEFQAGRNVDFSLPIDAGGGNYITVDNATGLVWKTCSEGTQTGAACSPGSPDTSDWSTASSYCDALNSGAGYGGRRDWRLPTIEELETLMNYNTATSPRTFGSSFPNTDSSKDYWTESVSHIYGAFPGDYWTGVFDSTVAISMVLSNFGYTRCISPGSASLSAPSYRDNGDGTVTDRSTGLIWQKCIQGQNNDASCSGGPSTPITGWNNALTYCNNLSLAGRSWRLPHINELKSILDRNTSSFPPIDATFFPNTSTGNYWTSSTSASSTSSVHGVFFYYDSYPTSMLPKNSNAYVRCVSSED